MLDLKAKLAAAGVVSAKQVKEFDEKEAKSKDARRRKPAASKKPQEHRKPNRSGKSQSSSKRGGPRKKKTGTATDVATLKTLNRGEAYVRIRKVVEHSRLDDKEQTIPGVDDQTFNFVTMKGRIGKLYVTAETAKKLSEGKAAISAFMSHHGLSHCVLPKDIAVDFAQVFPLWLRHLRGNEAAGQLEAPPEEAKSSKTESSAEKSSDESIPGQASDEAKSTQATNEAEPEQAADEAKSDQALGEPKSAQVSEAVPSDKASLEQAKGDPSSIDS